MLEVKFYENVDEDLLKFAVIVSKYKDKWVYCKHKARETYEIPGGHREVDEDIYDTAKRELYEETGATRFDLQEVGIYSVTNEGIESFGMLYFAQIEEFGEMPDLEIEKIILCDETPMPQTYPLIQPKLMKKVIEVLEQGKIYGGKDENKSC